MLRPRLAGCGQRLAGWGPRLAGCGQRLAGWGPRLADSRPRLAGCGPTLADSRHRLAGCGLTLAGCGQRLAGQLAETCRLRVEICGSRATLLECGLKFVSHAPKTNLETFMNKNVPIFSQW